MKKYSPCCRFCKHGLADCRAMERTSSFYRSFDQVSPVLKAGAFDHILWQNELGHGHHQDILYGKVT